MNQPKRLLVIEAGSGHGGSAYSLSRLCRGIAATKRNAIEVFWIGRNENSLTVPRTAGIPCQVCSGSESPLSFLRYRKIMRDFLPDHVHCNNPPYGHIWAILAAASLGIPCSTHYRCSRPVTRLERILMRQISHVFCDSNTGEAALLEAGIPAGKVHFVPNALWVPDYENIDPHTLRAELGLDDETYVVALPAALHPGKGQLDAIAATHILIAKGIDCHLLLAGEEHFHHAGFKSRLEQAVQESQLDGRVHFLGHRDDLPAVLAASDVIVQPSSLTEGWPMTILEAMATGRPVVASNVGGIPDIVDKEAGILIPPGAPHRLADSLEELRNSPERRETMGKRAKERVRQRHDACRAAGAFLGVLFGPCAGGLENGSEDNNSPSLSVIIPAYNAAAYIEQAVDSVIAERDHGVREILLIEDGSTDNTLQVSQSLAERHPDLIRLLRHPNGENKGAGATRNLGIQKAVGEYICFLDADDYWLPDRLDVPMRILESSPDIEGVYDLARLQYDDDSKKGERASGETISGIQRRIESPEDLFVEMLEGAGTWMTNNIILRQKVFEKVGVFNEELRLAQDAELWLRLAAKCRLLQSPQSEPTTIYRRHPTNRANIEWLKTASHDEVWGFYEPRYLSWNRWFDQGEVAPEKRRLFRKHYIRQLIWYRQSGKIWPVARKYGLQAWTLYRIARNRLSGRGYQPQQNRSR